MYWFFCSALQWFKCAFHFRSGGTRCVVFALATSFTVSNDVSNFSGAVSFIRSVSRSKFVSLVSQRKSEVSILFKAIKNSLVLDVFLLANLRFECDF